ncbi:YwqJ-related putative deaminase [Streptomyces sp. NPDC002265]|uniref:YwqJ-related putative deaminase n=1 Tax=Streptomyces sp. NPDC002265 TaxID=3154415 RepID=UPI003332F0B0
MPDLRTSTDHVRLRYGFSGPAAGSGVTLSSATTIAAARLQADKASATVPSRARPAVAEALQLADGQIYSASSVKGVAPTLHPLVEEILDAVPVADRGRAHGKCGLPQCISEALTAGHNPTGSQAAAVTVRSSTTHAGHGQPVGPCDSCVALEDAFEIDFVTVR